MHRDELIALTAFSVGIPSNTINDSVLPACDSTKQLTQDILLFNTDNTGGYYWPGVLVP